LPEASSITHLLALLLLGDLLRLDLDAGQVGEFPLM